MDNKYNLLATDNVYFFISICGYIFKYILFYIKQHPSDIAKFNYHIWALALQ